MNEKEINELVGKQIFLAKWVFDKTKDYPVEKQLKIYEEVNKDIRTIEINQQKQSEKPTDKQLDFARNLGIEFPEKYTKKELSEKINEVKNIRFIPG